MSSQEADTYRHGTIPDMVQYWYGKDDCVTCRLQERCRQVVQWRNIRRVWRLTSQDMTALFFLRFISSSLTAGPPPSSVSCSARHDVKWIQKYHSCLCPGLEFE